MTAIDVHLFQIQELSLQLQLLGKVTFKSKVANCILSNDMLIIAENHQAAANVEFYGIVQPLEKFIRPRLVHVPSQLRLHELRISQASAQTFAL